MRQSKDWQSQSVAEILLNDGGEPGWTDPLHDVVAALGRILTIHLVAHGVCVSAICIGPVPTELALELQDMG